MLVYLVVFKIHYSVWVSMGVQVCVCEGEEGTMRKTKPSWHWE